MGTGNNPNRIDYADIIKSRVSIPDVVERYTGQKIDHNRICCPVHHGTDKNMRIYKNTYHCFVCHATGDVIQFVRAVTGDSFQEAMQRLNQDFALNLPLDGAKRSDLDKNGLAKIAQEIAERNWQNTLKDADETINGMHQANLAGLVQSVEIICKSDAPKRQEDVWSDHWCEAMRLRTLLYGEIR